MLVVISVVLYNPKEFSPASLSPKYSYGADVFVRWHEVRALDVSERVGEGRLPGPEDLAYDVAARWLYMGCANGWVRRVSIPGGDVEDWVNTDGRPLGIVLAGDGGIIVADADKEIPTLYDDDGQMRLFIRWDKSGSNGFFNLMCPGFVQVTDRLALSAVLAPTSEAGGSQFEAQLAVYNDGSACLSLGGYLQC